MDERMYWVAWSRMPKLGGRRLQALFREFGSLEAAWAAPVSRIADVPDFGIKLACEAVAWRKSTSVADEWVRASFSHSRTVTWVDDDYPAPLRDLHDPPPALYVMGELPRWERAIAIVGNRAATDYGLGVA